MNNAVMNNADVIQRALAKLVAAESTPARLMGVEPRVVNGLYAIGLRAQQLGRHRDADNVFQRCLLLDPFRADFWIALAVSRQAVGRVDEAGEIYQIAGLMTEDLAPVAYAAACFAEVGQLDRARVLVEHVREGGVDLEALSPWLSLVDSKSKNSEVRHERD